LNRPPFVATGTTLCLLMMEAWCPSRGTTMRTSGRASLTEVLFDLADFFNYSFQMWAVSSNVMTIISEAVSCPSSKMKSDVSSRIYSPLFVLPKYKPWVTALRSRRCRWSRAMISSTTLTRSRSLRCWRIIFNLSNFDCVWRRSRRMPHSTGSISVTASNAADVHALN
jgi:hypothetical protein